MRGAIRPLLAALVALGLLAGAAGCGTGQSQGAAKGSRSSQSASGEKGSTGHKGSGGKSGSGGTRAAGQKSGATSGNGAETSASGSRQVAGAAPTYHFYLSVLTGGMIGKPGSPLFTPADFTLPPKSHVLVTIRNFDSGTAPVTAQWSRVSGTLGGTIRIAGKSVRSIAPTQVSHTFTVARLHLNVPIPASATVSFALRTPASGTYTWRCEAPCGSGPSGMQGAMRTNGYMMGTMRISAT